MKYLLPLALKIIGSITFWSGLLTYSDNQQHGLWQMAFGGWITASAAFLLAWIAIKPTDQKGG